MTQTSPTLKNPHRGGSYFLIRLERTNKEILSLKESLNSYVCEPKTYSLFERFEGLKRRMDGMMSMNSEIIDRLRNPKDSFDSLVDRIKDQIKDFKELERNVLEYIGMAKMHC